MASRKSSWKVSFMASRRRRGGEEEVHPWLLEGGRRKGLRVYLERRRYDLLDLLLEEEFFFLLPCKNKVRCCPLDVSIHRNSFLVLEFHLGSNLCIGLSLYVTIEMFFGSLS